MTSGEQPSMSVPRYLGKYELVRPLAQGGMADLYLARRGGPGEFERHVAVKVLNQERAADAESCALFIDEARVVARLNHHNVARVLDVAVEDGVHYLTMEYVHGADLRGVLLECARTGSMPSYEVSLAIIAQAAAGLDHAHRRCGPDGKPLKLVHRDVSLSNIMVGHDGSVKIVDFGIARSTMSTVHTSPGVVRGKASYMSPEQCVGDPVDHRTDVFALGIVLYELTTGARCFNGKSDFDRMLAVVRGDFIAPSALIADYPPELELVVRTALATEPDLRYASCAAMIEAIERVLAGRGWTAGAVVIARAMRVLFGDVPEPWAHLAAPHATAADPDDAPRTIEDIMPRIAVVAAPTTRLTRAKRFARGTVVDGFEPGPHGALDDDDDDARTRGRRPVRRASSPRIAA